MNVSLKKVAIPGLRWTVGLVTLAESCRFVFTSSGAHAAGNVGLPHWIRFALGGSEIIAAILFLVPAASVVGGYFLLGIFFLAAVIHLLHGQWDVGGLLVYGMAVVVCVAYREDQKKI
jgi:hypothetical protein